MLPFTPLTRIAYYGVIDDYNLLKKTLCMQNRRNIFSILNIFITLHTISNMSSRFSRNSEVFALELQENLEEMLSLALHAK